MQKLFTDLEEITINDYHLTRAGLWINYNLKGSDKEFNLDATPEQAAGLLKIAGLLLDTSICEGSLQVRVEVNMKGFGIKRPYIDWDEYVLTTSLSQSQLLNIVKAHEDNKGCAQIYEFAKVPDLIKNMCNAN